ncbi:ABC1 kinase family protein [Rubritalea tangerina]|uniref:ABC1 kinase family protein n=1 Tax=Rubritalea tangerina TaxID=430798 RepID=A0ABW4ZEK3_9BACT
MKEQTSIPKHKIGRAASLTAAGARVGVNYLKFAGKKALTGKDTKADFHEATASEAFGTFSKLKGSPLKLAQMLSMDRNLLPEPYVREFSKAQYSAPPLSYPLVVKTFLSELGSPPDQLFDTFSKKATAGASIGQVHKATHHGHDFAVKIQYPGVADSIHSDLAIVKPLAMRLFKLDARAINPYLKEVEDRLTEETDYTLELQRSEQLADQSKQIPGIRFPKFHPHLSTHRILTMDWVHGEVLDQFFDRNTNQKLANQIGQSLWDFYHHQVHTLRVFHADPHPGNFKVHDEELWILDFGCVKELPDEFYHQYFSLMDPEIFHDHDRFVSLLYDIGLLLPDDSPSAVKKLTQVFRESVDLLSRPFQQETFDFGDESYFRELADFGDRTRDDAELQSLNSARGNADALYLNRTYFGLYNLAGALNATIKTTRPTLRK